MFKLKNKIGDAYQFHELGAHLRIYSLIIFLFLITSCTKPPSPVIKLSEAEIKFKKICAEEYKLDIKTKMVGSSLWLYLPIKTNILAVKSTDEGPSDTGESKESQSLRYIKGTFENEKFVISYDVGKVKTYSKQFGYTSSYSEEYQKIQNNILFALSRSYFDVENGKNGELGTRPRFIVLTVSDITTGIEIESVIYFEDLKRAMSLIPSIPQDEFSKRYLTELRGQKSIIGDDDGTHLQYREIMMTEFLARQIAYRVSFKYQQSSFLPVADARAEIINIIQETFSAYQFKEFDSVVLKDLDKKTQETVKIDLSAENMKNPSGGTLHTITFP